MHNHGIARDGFTGTLLGISVSINTNDLLSSCILAACGAVVSFTVSYLLNKLFRKKR